MCKIVVIALFPGGYSVFFDIFFSTWPRVQLFLQLGPLYGELLPLAHLQELCLDELHWNKLGGSRSFIGDQANLTRDGEGGGAVEPVDVLVQPDCHLAQFVKKNISLVEPHRCGREPATGLAAEDLRKVLGRKAGTCLRVTKHFTIFVNCEIKISSCFAIN